MKKGIILLIALMCLTPIDSKAGFLGIVDRTATRDTLAIPFAFLDSLGNPVTGAAGDSILVVITSPAGVEVFRDSVLLAGVTAYSWEDQPSTYAYTDKVSVLDGSSTAVGTFSYQVQARDISLALTSYYSGTFQIINSTLESQLDSAAFAQKAVDSLADVLDSLETMSAWIQDSLYAIIDSLQNHDDWVAREATVQIIDDSLDVYDTRWDSTLAALADASIGDKVWIDAAARTLSALGFSIDSTDFSDSAFVARLFATNYWTELAQRADSGAFVISPWNATTRDSVLNAILDANKGNFKAAGFSTHAALDVWNIAFSTGFAAGSMGDSLNNSSYVQGSGSAGNDSISIARWIWNTPQLNHTVVGTFGKYLDSEISGIGSGSGIYSYQVITYDSATSQPVPGVAIAIRNLAQSALVAVSTSDLNGQGAVNLDADSHIVIARAPGYIFNPFDTIAVTGAGVDTIFGYRFDPGNPSSPDLCRVFGYLFNIDGSPESKAIITAHLPKGVTRIGSSIVSPFSVLTVTDSIGYWAIDIVPSTLLTPSTSKYEFLITRKDGTILRKRVLVPDQTNWQLTW